MDSTYDALNGAWKKTCKILLDEEIGDLSAYRDYLKKFTEPIEQKKSSISGKPVIVTSGKFPKDARFISNEEAGQYISMMKGEPLDINKIKDIDSIREAVSERAYFAGSIVLGNSSHVELSHRCVNLHYGYECQDIYDGKYVAFATAMKGPEYFFGGSVGSMSQFCIKTFENYKMMRCLETLHCNIASDCYFSATLENCVDCIFSFNQRDRRNLVGNVELQKDEYLALKKKLIGEAREMLISKKSIPSISEIIGGHNG